MLQMIPSALKQIKKAREQFNFDALHKIQELMFSLLNSISFHLFAECIYYIDVLLQNIGSHFAVSCVHVILQVLLQ